MTRSSTSNLESFDSKIERTFQKLHNLVKENLSPRKQVKMEETPAFRATIRARAGIRVVVRAIGEVGDQNDRRTLMEYVQPSIDETVSCIRKPVVQANNFELKPFYV